MPLQGLPVAVTVPPCSLVSLGGEEPRLVGVVGGVLFMAALASLAEQICSSEPSRRMNSDQMTWCKGSPSGRMRSAAARRAPNGRGRGQSLHPCARAAGRYASVETALKGRSTGVWMEQRTGASCTGDNTREPAG